MFIRSLCVILLTLPLGVAAAPDPVDPDDLVKRERRGSQMKPLEQAYEVEELDLAVDSKGVGNVKVDPQCPPCGPTTLAIKANVELRVAGRKQPLARLGSHKGKPGAILYKHGTDLVTRIFVY